MVKIPIPFIGGSEAARRSRSERHSLEAPFYPGGPQGEAEAPERPQPSEASKQEAGTEARAASGSREPPEPETAAGDVEAGPAELEEDAADIPDWLLGSDEQAEVQRPVEPEAAAAVTAPDEEKTLDELGSVAEQLMSGAHADWVRTLIANLSPYDSEIAVPRAFAAGYLAGRAEEETA